MTKKAFLRSLSLVLVLLTALTAVVFAGCGSATSETAGGGSESQGSENSGSSATPSDGGSNIAVIDVKDYGTITVELYPDIAPITVANFKKLINEKFYDGLTFHRIISGFMIQGGDPLGNGTGGSDENIKGEFANNGVSNNLSHTRGVISMARSQDMNSASSQFFIVHQDSTYLDGQYAAFGKVTEGIEVVDAIAANTTVQDANGTVLPADQPVINSITLK